MTTFEQAADTIGAVIKQQQPGLSDNMAIAFAVLAMADFRERMKLLENDSSENNFVKH